jgi:hypothetical protein
MDWNPILLPVDAAVWQGPPGADHRQTRLRVNDIVLDLHAVAACTDDGVQSLVDPGVERHLLGLYNPEEPLQTYRDFHREYVLYAVPAAYQAAPAELSCQVPVDTFLDKPDEVEYDRLLAPLAVPGHCMLHLEARAVTDDATFAAYPEDLADVQALSGWDGPYPTYAMLGRRYVFLAYPYGD